MKTHIDHEDPILQDQELIDLTKQALGDNKVYGRGLADLETVRERLHKPVPLVEITCKASSPRELRDTNRREELIMALKVINNEVSMTDFREFIEHQQEEYLAKNTIGNKKVVDLKT